MYVCVFNMDLVIVSKSSSKSPQKLIFLRECLILDLNSYPFSLLFQLGMERCMGKSKLKCTFKCQLVTVYSGVPLKDGRLYDTLLSNRECTSICFYSNVLANDFQSAILVYLS